MAIEVITKGVKPENRGVTGKCTNCLSGLRWVASDGEHRSDQRDGDCNVVRCPVCGNRVYGEYVDEKRRPSGDLPWAQ